MNIKKLVFVLITFILINTPLMSQRSIYYDALYLKTIADANNGKFKLSAETRKVLDHYFKSDPSDFTYSEKIEANPFLKGVFERTGSQSMPASLSGVANILGQVGGLDVTNIADGLAKFMAERFKEELELTFFKKFKQDLEDPKYHDLQILFPASFNILELIGTDIYQYNAFLQSLRESFKKDISNLYINLNTLLKGEEFIPFFDAHKDLHAFIFNSLYIIDKFSHEIHPGEMLAQYDADKLLTFNNSELQNMIRGSVKTIQLISNSFRQIENKSGYWVSPDSISMLLNNNIGLKIYLGLIYQKSSNITFSNTVSLKSLLDNVAEDSLGNSILERYRNYILEFVDYSNTISLSISNLQDKAKKNIPIDYTEYYRLFDSTYDILQLSFSMLDLPYVNNYVKNNFNETTMTSFKNNAKLLTNIARSFGNLYIDVKIKNYSNAILDIVAIFDGISEKGKNEIDSIVVVRTALLKYGTFMANMISAKNSDEVRNSIEAIVLPAGSASIKKESCFNISLNSYLGGFYGNEYLGDKISGNWRQSFGISAPIGIAASFGFGSCSASLFLSVIDIGALASFRLKDTSANLLPVKLGNIFAPGFGLIFGMPFGWPVSIGYLYQFGPALREINAGSEVLTGKLNNRWYVFLGVDIPLFNLLTVPK